MIEIGSTIIAPLITVDINQVITEAINDNADYLSDQNTLQLDQGLDSKGKDLGTYARYDYKDRWRPVDLKLAGAFRRSIKPKTLTSAFEMEATDSKSDKLMDMFGENILGIPEQSIGDVAEYIKEDVQTIYRREVLS